MDSVRQGAEDLVLLARIVRPQGRQGEVMAELHTDFPLSLPGRNGLLLTRPSGESTPCRVERAWLPTGKNAGRVVLKISGVDDISQADALRDALLQVPSFQRLALEEGTYYVSDLAGCSLFSDGIRIGTITGVQVPTGPGGQPVAEAAPLLTVEAASGREVLVPFVKDLVSRVSIDERRMDMHLPPGLVDINS